MEYAEVLFDDSNFTLGGSLPALHRTADGSNSSTFDALNFSLSLTNSSTNNSMAEPESLELNVAVSITYAIIFLAGILGNVITCVVISRNRSMRTAADFHLFSLAVSDLILLVCGLPLEMNKMWHKMPQNPLGQGFCIAFGLASEAAANARVLTIMAFTVERYIAICRPFISHTISDPERIVYFITVVWITALLTAIPRAPHFGLIAGYINGEGVHHAFILLSSSLFSFVIPMMIVLVLYALIAVKLRTLKLAVESQEHNSAGSPNRCRNAQRRVIRMLLAVALTCCVCWAPHHVQRLLAMQGKESHLPSCYFCKAYVALTWISGIMRYLSTAITPFLYSIMSNKFRNAFKLTFSGCRAGRRRMNRSNSTAQAFRSQRAACASEHHPRRLHRLNTASTQLGDAPTRAQFNFAEEDYSLEKPSPYMNTWSYQRRHSPSWSLQHSETRDSVASVSNSSLRETNEEMSA